MHTLSELKSLVYGRGRGTGIQITPRRHDGDDREQILSLARDTIAAAKYPSDEEDATMVESCSELGELLEADANADCVANALSRYIQSRVRWTGHGAVE